jgi:acetoin utilization protein AcuA
MNNTSLHILTLDTPVGAVRIKSFCSPEEIQQCQFDSRFGTYAQYKSLYTKRESLEKSAGLPDANITLALADNTHIVGYGVLVYPDAHERWARLEPNIMMELAAIEVSRDWRSGGVARGIVEMMLSGPKVEDKIIYLVGYSWTWDLDGSGKSAQTYRTMLIHLFEQFGFNEYQTNDANISLKPENIFMARIGMNVSDEKRKAFKWLRFDLPL